MKNEPAFPVVGFLTDDGKMMGQLCHGMTLRDYFAAKFAEIEYRLVDFSDDQWRMNAAINAYAMADAMLKAREETK